MMCSYTQTIHVQRSMTDTRLAFASGLKNSPLNSSQLSQIEQITVTWKPIPAALAKQLDIMSPFSNYYTRVCSFNTGIHMS